MLNPPAIICPKLPAFDAGDLDAVMLAFQRAPATALRQFWRYQPEPHFLPATVWAGWRETTFLVFGKMTDTTIVTFATQPNERLWELGDVWEIFLRPAGQTAYSEFQIAPNNQRLQLRYANAEALERARLNNSIAHAVVHDISFKSRTWVRPEANCWYALAEIPAASVCDAPSPLPGSHWHFSFSRYDYTRGTSQPVISSSSAHSLPDFHRQTEWGTLQFQPSATNMNPPTQSASPALDEVPAAAARPPQPAPKPRHDLRAVTRHFQLHGEFVSAAPYGNGHINDTYCVVCDQGGSPVRYISQRINHNIFKNPVALMENVRRVTDHLAGKLAAAPDRTRRVLTVIPARDGKSYHCDADGNYWRVYIFIEKAATYDAVETTQQAFAAAKAFGRFQNLLADLPAPRLHDTIPDFHHTPKRFAAFEAALAADAFNRAALARPEIEFALANRLMAGVLLDARLPERVTHNDTKLNNVMLDEATGEGICVIDLDTVMPGLALYDFGDMVRTTTSPAREDERDLTKVRMQFPMFEALVRGYLASAAGHLTAAERSFLPFAGKLITFEIGLRFLTDFLAGDSYFKVHRENHNLDRCRTQFKLVESIARQEEPMNRLVETI